MTVVARRRGMGASFLEDLASGFSDSLKADATDWLVREYAALRNAPQEIARLRVLASKLSQVVIDRSGSADLQGQIASVPVRLQTLTAQYPAMMANVNAAYKIVSDAAAGVAPATGTNLFTAATGAIAAVAQAKGFMADLGDVSKTTNSAIDQMVGVNMISPDEANHLLTAGAPSSIDWGKVLMWGGGIGLLAWALTRRRG